MRMIGGSQICEFWEGGDMEGLTWRERLERLRRARAGLDEAARALAGLGDEEALREALLDAGTRLDRRAEALHRRCEERELAEDRALAREYFRGLL